MQECSVCGCPFGEEVVESATYDEDGELLEPAEIAEYPQCDCQEFLGGDY